MHDYYKMIVIIELICVCGGRDVYCVRGRGGMCIVCGEGEVLCVWGGGMCIVCEEGEVCVLGVGRGRCVYCVGGGGMCIVCGEGEVCILCGGCVLCGGGEGCVLCVGRGEGMCIVRVDGTFTINCIIFLLIWCFRSSVFARLI